MAESLCAHGREGTAIALAVNVRSGSRSRWQHTKSPDSGVPCGSRHDRSSSKQERY